MNSEQSARNHASPSASDSPYAEKATGAPPRAAAPPTASMATRASPLASEPLALASAAAASVATFLRSSVTIRSVQHALLPGREGGDTTVRGGGTPLLGEGVYLRREDEAGWGV